jgi:hypothetical protein
VTAPSATRAPEREHDGPAPASARRPGRARAAAARDWLAGHRWLLGQIALLAAVYFAYTRLRMMAEGARWLAARNASDVIDLERSLGLFHEARVQDAFIEHVTVMKAWNVYYGFVHFAVPLLAIAVLLRGDRTRYRRWRNTFWFLCGLGLVGFTLYPLMPPRFLPSSFGFVDSMNVIGGPGIQQQGASEVANAYAAMPSLHGGWSLWCACALVPVLRRRWAKGLVALHPIIQFFAIMVTGNHFWIDAVVGWMCLAVAYALARVVESLALWRAEPERDVGLEPVPALVEREATARSG